MQEIAADGLAEDWWSTVQNVGQVIVTLAIPLGAALLAFRRWGTTTLTASAVDEIREMRAENTTQHVENADRLEVVRVEITAAHEKLHGRIDESQTELAAHITRHDATATSISEKVDRVERTLDRMLDNLLRRNE
jgi:hypothetical protein